MLKSCQGEWNGGFCLISMYKVYKIHGSELSQPTGMLPTCSFLLQEAIETDTRELLYIPKGRYAEAIPPPAYASGYFLPSKSTSICTKHW